MQSVFFRPATLAVGNHRGFRIPSGAQQRRVTITRFRATNPRPPGGRMVVTLPRQPQRISNRVEQCPPIVCSQNSIPVQDGYPFHACTARPIDNPAVLLLAHAPRGSKNKDPPSLLRVIANVASACVAAIGVREGSSPLPLR